MGDSVKRAAEVVGDFYAQFPVIAWTATVGAALVALSAAVYVTAVVDERP